MMQPSTIRPNSPSDAIPNGHGSGAGARNRGGREKNPREENDIVRDDESRRRNRQYTNEDYSTPQSTSYLGGFCRWCCTFQHFCYLVQLINCCLLCGLIYLILQEYPKFKALDELDKLQKELEEEKAELAALQEEVHTKQNGQLNDIEESLKQEQRNNFLTLAGIFTLLTCLISMFHMTTHVHKLHQPQIQRKILAILWMSPIYSVTSFLTLILPTIEGWMAIIKDFYESYCIYVFLSFLIAVLGEGSRDKAVEVLAKNSDHLDRPTKCLGCFYEPPPDTSDRAKANAVMTQCQIYCLQFTLVRPITTIVRVFVLQRDKKDSDKNEQSSNSDDFSDYTAQDDGDVGGNNDKWAYDGQPNNNTDFAEDESNEVLESPETSSDNVNASSATNSADDGGGTRMLRDSQTKRRELQHTQNNRESLFQIEGGDILAPRILLENTANNENDDTPLVEFPSLAPAGVEDNRFPTPTFTVEEMPSLGNEFPASFDPNSVDGDLPTISSIAEVDSDSEIYVAPSFDSNSTGLGGGFVSNSTDVNFPTMLPSLGPSESGGMSTELIDETKAYFKSPGFACAMVVNISIFFAFSGLLKLYHAVRDDLLWCRPFPKFLTIKAVVFLTFWQGLAITIYVVLTVDPSQQDDAILQAHRYQNLLICVEMLLVAISQWCVFPSVEWEPNYEPRQMQTPGFGIKDFVSDVGQIVKNSTQSKRKERRRKKRGGGSSSKSAGLYHMPGSASMVSSQFNGFGTRADSSFEDEDVDFEHSSVDNSFDSGDTLDRRNVSIDDSGIVENEDAISPYGYSSEDPEANRDRTQSDDNELL